MGIGKIQTFTFIGPSISLRNELKKSRFEFSVRWNLRTSKIPIWLCLYYTRIVKEKTIQKIQFPILFFSLLLWDRLTALNNFKPLANVCWAASSSSKGNEILDTFSIEFTFHCDVRLANVSCPVITWKFSVRVVPYLTNAANEFGPYLLYGKASLFDKITTH